MPCRVAPSVVSVVALGCLCLADLALLSTLVLGQAAAWPACTLGVASLCLGWRPGPDATRGDGRIRSVTGATILVAAGVALANDRLLMAGMVLNCAGLICGRRARSARPAPPATSEDRP